MRVIALSALVLPLASMGPRRETVLSRGRVFDPQRGARRFPAAELFPADDLEAQAHVISWMSFIASTIHPTRRIGGARADRCVFEGSVERWKEVFEIAEKRLGPQNWVAGRYSIGDIHLFRLYWRFVESTRPAPGTFPGLSAHYDRMMARPAVRRVLEIESAVGYCVPQ
jgi:glutathione S-transferase